MMERTKLTLAGISILLLTHVAVWAQQEPDPILREDGIFPGVYLGSGGEETVITPTEFFATTWRDRKVSFFSRYVKLTNNIKVDGLVAGTMEYFADDPAFATTASFKVNPVVFIEPEVGLDALKDTTAPVFAPYKAALDYFRDYCADNLADLDRIVVVFGHEMNGHWYTWGQQPTLYVKAFRNVANILRRPGNNIKMCWMPNQGWKYPSFGVEKAKWDPTGEKSQDALVFGATNDTTAQQKAYRHYYPGADFVDWVGLTFYCRRMFDLRKADGRWHFLGGIKDPVHFYNLYAKGDATGNGKKPMIIGETSFHADSLLDNEDEQQRLQERWLGMVYGPEVAYEFKYLKVVSWFNVRKREDDGVVRDYRIGQLDAASFRAYVDTLGVKDSTRLLGVFQYHVPSPSGLVIFPNPCPASSLTARVADAFAMSFKVSIHDVLGRVRSVLHMEHPDMEFTIPIDGLPPGLYILAVSDGMHARSATFLKR